MSYPRQIRTVFFGGVVEEAAGDVAGNVTRLQRTPILSQNEVVTITNAWIESCSAPGSGGSSTTIKISDAAWNGTATDEIELTVESDETSCAAVEGSISIAAAGYPYVYIDAGGGHSNIEVVIEYQPAGDSEVASGTTLYPSTPIAIARKRAGDSKTTYHIEDTDFLRWLLDAQTQILTWKRRERLQADGTEIAIPSTVTSGVVMGVSAKWTSTLADWCEAEYRGTLDPDRANEATAKSARARFYAAIGRSIPA